METRIEINKENVLDFLEKYHEFHDSRIISVEYRPQESKAIIELQISWEGSIPISELIEKRIKPIENIVVLTFEEVSTFNWPFFDDMYYLFEIYLKISRSKKPKIIFSIGEDFNCDKATLEGKKPTSWPFVVSHKLFYYSKKEEI